MTPFGTRTVRAFSVGSCALAVLLLVALAGSACAAEVSGYGEVTRFGTSSHDARATSRTPEAGTNELSEARTLSIGVDPAEENSVFVLEEREEPELNEPETQMTRFFRLKKFTASLSKGKTTYSEVASHEFEETSPHLISQELRLEQPAVNGLAVDAKTGRLFLLTADLRAEADTIDTTEGKQENTAVLAASTLYSFKTAELAPVDETHLEPQSDTPGKALLDPQGIAVDPATEEAIVLAHIDEAGHANDSIASATDHFVLQRIKPGVGPTATYVDRTNKFKESLDGLLLSPTSPVVVPGSKEGEERVMVDWDFGLTEVPYPCMKENSTTKVCEEHNFGSTAPVTLALSQPFPGGGPSGENEQEGLLAGAQSPTDLEYTEAHYPLGGRLSVSPEGTAFGPTDVKDESEGSGLEAREGVLALSGLTGEMIGWTGGAISQGNTTKDNACVVEPLSLGLREQVAAGSGGDVFVLAPQFLRQKEEEREVVDEHEIENPPGSEEFETVFEEEVTFGPLHEAVTGPAIIEFGPGGTGCEEASAEGIEDEVNSVKGREEEPPGTEITFTSAVKQGDAIKVEWTFEVEGKPETKKTVLQSAAELRVKGNPPRYRHPSVTEALTALGKYKVSEKIYSDALADSSEAEYSDGHLVSPSFSLTLAHKLEITPGKPVGTFTFTPSEPEVGQSVDFEAKVSDPNGPEAQPLKYTWSFGDGTTSGPSTTATATHAFGEAKSYTVKLTVEDKFKKALEVTRTVTVKAKKEPVKEPEKEKPIEGSTNAGGNEGGAGNDGSSGGGNTGNTGVLSYAASFSPSSTVSKSGSVTVTVDCSGQSSCDGTITLKTVRAYAAKKGKHKSIVTLGSAAFNIVGGAKRVVTVRLSSQGRALLAQYHELTVRASIAATDAAGHSHSASATVTLKLAKPKPKSHKH